MRWCLKSTASRWFAQPVVQAQFKENIKAPRHWPLWGGYTGDQWIPPHKGPVTGKILVWVGMRVGIGWWVGMGCKKVPTILLPQRQWSVKNPRMGLLPDTQTCVLRMRRECRERFPRPLAQRKPLVSDPYMHHGTCVMHVPWCMSGLLTRGDGENVPGIPGTFATCNCTYLVRGPWGQMNLMSSLISFNVAKQKPPCADIDLICWFVFFLRNNIVSIWTLFRLCLRNAHTFIKLTQNRRHFINNIFKCIFVMKMLAFQF